MKRLAVFSFVLAVSASILSADEGHTRSFSTRSMLYEMDVTVEALPDAQYDFRFGVKDLSTNTEVVNDRVKSSQGASVEMKTEKDGTVFTVGLRLFFDSLSAKVTVERNGAVVDTLLRTWNDADPAMKHLVAPGALHVGGNVRAPIVISRVEPLYPAAARKDRIAGIVIVEVLIDKTGNVVDATVLKDLPDGLGEAAVDAFRQWKFKPATMNGEPVDVIFNLTTSFKLGDVKPQP